MDKEAVSYGFKAFPNREEAIDLIADRDNFDSEMALDDMANTDYDYGFTYKNRKNINKLDKLGLGDAIKSSGGFIEESRGYTRKPDIYATPEGAEIASIFIRTEILPGYKNIDQDIASADDKEIEYVNKINSKRELYNAKKINLESRLRDSDADFQATRSADLINRMRGRVAQASGQIDKGRISLNESLYRRDIDRYKKKISDVPKSVMYSRFADSIDRSIDDSNELYNFRYY